MSETRSVITSVLIINHNYTTGLSPPPLAPPTLRALLSSVSCRCWSAEATLT